MTHNWNPNCTHVLVNQSMPLTEDVIDAFVAKKPFVLKDWIGVCLHFISLNMSHECLFLIILDEVDASKGVVNYRYQW